MKRLISREEIYKMVFGEPSVQTGEAITHQEVTDALRENEEIVKKLITKEYTHIIDEASSAPPSYANYGCYGQKENIEFYVIEVYQFKNIKHSGEILTIALAKKFEWKIKEKAKDKPTEKLTENDIEITYIGKPIAEISEDKFANLYDETKVMINGLSLDLINVENGTPPDKFILKMLKEEKIERA